MCLKGLQQSEYSHVRINDGDAATVLTAPQKHPHAYRGRLLARTHPSSVVYSQFLTQRNL